MYYLFFAAFRYNDATRYTGGATRRDNFHDFPACLEARARDFEKTPQGPATRSCVPTGVPRNSREIKNKFALISHNVLLFAMCLKVSCDSHRFPQHTCINKPWLLNASLIIGILFGIEFDYRCKQI